MYPGYPGYPGYFPYPYYYYPSAAPTSNASAPRSEQSSEPREDDPDVEDPDHDDDTSDNEKKGIDLDDPSCKFSKVCSKKKKSHPVSDFVLSHWRELKGFDDEGLFDTKKFPKDGAWKKFKPVSALVDYHGNALQFGPPIPESELVSLGSSGYSVDAEKEYKLLQKHVGAVSHLLLQAQEGFESNYTKMRELFASIPLDFSLPEYAPFKSAFDALCEESIKEVSGQIGRAARVSSALHTDITDKRRKLYVKQMKKSHSSTLADQLEKFPPSETHLFSKRVSELEKSVHLEFLSKMASSRVPYKATGNSTYKSSYSAKRKHDFRDSVNKKKFSGSKNSRFDKGNSSRQPGSTGGSN